MSLYLLDSDIITLFVSGHRQVCQRVLSCSPAELTTSVVCVEELLTGWYSLLRKGKNDAQIVSAYRRMTETLNLLKHFHITSFDDQCAQRFRGLRAGKNRIGTMDLRIACTALEANAILVTRNRSDFGTIQGLQLQDWSL